MNEQKYIYKNATSFITPMHSMLKVLPICMCCYRSAIDRYVYCTNIWDRL